MGRKTRYHPVSLHVLRGALEYCGIAIGRLKQLRSDQANGHAWYTAEIISTPKDFDNLSIRDLEKAIRGCFADDVDVIAIRQVFRRKEKFYTLSVDLFAHATPSMPIDKYISDIQDTYTQAYNDEKRSREKSALATDFPF